MALPQLKVTGNHQVRGGVWSSSVSNKNDWSWTFKASGVTKDRPSVWSRWWWWSIKTPWSFWIYFCFLVLVLSSAAGSLCSWCIFVCLVVNLERVCVRLKTPRDTFHQLRQLWISTSLPPLAPPFSFCRLLSSLPNAGHHLILLAAGAPQAHARARTRTHVRVQTHHRKHRTVDARPLWCSGPPWPPGESWLVWFIETDKIKKKIWVKTYENKICAKVF